MRINQADAVFDNCLYNDCFLMFSPSGKSIFSYDGLNSTSFQVLPGRWDTVLDIACRRLRHHPILTNPQDEMARGARETCQSYAPSWQAE